MSSACPSHVFQSASEPGVQRSTEADLAAVDDLIGQVPTGHLLDDPLRDPPTDFHRGRQTEREFDQVVVEKGRPQLQRSRHGHAVAPFEQVVR